MAETRICSIPGCGKPHDSRGYCQAHYNRLRRTGDPLGLNGVPPGTAYADSEAALRSGTDECVFWERAKKPDGRGNIKYQGKYYTPSRLVCILANGKPPELGLEAAHSCGNGHLSCINPRHLRWATPVENADDRIAHGRQVRGVLCQAAKLTEADIPEIRRLVADGLTLAAVASKYGVNRQSIANVRDGKTWSWI